MKKKRVWAASPVFYILSVLLFVMAGISWFQGNTTLFVVELVAAALAVAAVILSTEHFKAYVAAALKSAKSVLGAEEYGNLRDFTMPVAVIGEADDIVWVNDAFLATVSPGRELRGESVLKLIYPKTLQQLLEAGGTDIALEDRQFTVFASRTESGAILYFVDDTYYKEINREFEETRPVVALAYFDNREELARDSSGMEDARIASEVESCVNEWAVSMGGFCKRLSGGRYLILTDEGHLRTAMENRFEVLDAVRRVKGGENRSATISMGVARGAASLQEAERWSRAALDMALGRGGDQVAVKQKGGAYSFFGGLSKGVEKRDKVRTRVIAATLADHARASDCIFLMGHKFSDLDAVGAAVGLWSAMTKAVGMPAYVVINRGQTLAGPVVESIESQGPDSPHVFISPAEAAAMVTPKSLLIVVDTHSQDFVESPELLDACQRVVVIDHHRMMVRHIENALVFYHEPYASSASEMVAELVQYLGENCLNRREAGALLSGITLDTKNFVLKTGVRTFEAAAYLRRRGADTVEVKRMFSDSIEAYKKKYEIVSNAEISDSCAIASAREEFSDVRVISAQAADELLSIQGVKASFVIFPSGGQVNISARSLGEVNVQLIMEALGGGGHLTMAATQLTGVGIEEGRRLLKGAIRNVMERALPAKDS